MHFKLLSSEFAEYRAIKAHSTKLAFVWRLGHSAWGLSCICLLAVLLGFLMTMLDKDPAHAGIRWRFAGVWCGTYGFVGVALFAVGIVLKWSATRLDARRQTIA
jgi:hypothetical protein